MIQKALYCWVDISTGFLDVSFQLVADDKVISQGYAHPRMFRKILAEHVAEGFVPYYDRNSRGDDLSYLSVERVLCP